MEHPKFEVCGSSPSSITWYLARAFMLKAPYCWQRHRVQWTRGYCRAILRWFTNCIEPRYKSSALPFYLFSVNLSQPRIRATGRDDDIRVVSIFDKFVLFADWLQIAGSNYVWRRANCRTLYNAGIDGLVRRLVAAVLGTVRMSIKVINKQAWSGMSSWSNLWSMVDCRTTKI